MTVSELIEALRKYPPDTRVVACSGESWGEPCALLRSMFAIDKEDPEDPEASFVALSIGGDDELYEDMGPA